MHHAAGMSGLETGGDLHADLDGLVQRQGAGDQSLREILAGHQLHDQEADSPALVESVDRGDVGMIERGQQFRLALEAHQPVGVGAEGLRQDLDRHLAVERGVDRAPDLAHAALAELVDEPVVQQGLSGFDGQCNLR